MYELKYFGNILFWKYNGLKLFKVHVMAGETEINVHEPFRKTWSEPQIIVTREDIMEYEKSQAVHKERLKNPENSELENQTQTSSPRDTNLASTHQISEPLQELRNSLLQAQFIKQQMRTPQKCDGTIFDFRTQQTDSDWMIPEISRSRSLPSSPVIGLVSPQTPSLNIPSSEERYFNFLTRPREDLRFVPETDEVDNCPRLSPECCRSPAGFIKCSQHYYDSTARSSEDRSQVCPTGTSPYVDDKNQSTFNSPMRAKRKLDMDSPYNTSVKRTKSDAIQDAGLRYINQLEMDLLSLKHRLHCAGAERTYRPTHCACAKMEKDFMEMATSAYKSLRRYDGSLNSFDRFREELSQTNKIIKDSMELLQNVKRLCCH